MLCVAEICIPMLQGARTCRGIKEISKTFCNNRMLQARRVSEAWLNAYLSCADQAAVAALSVFVGSFNAEGAAAVMAEAGALEKAVG